MSSASASSISSASASTSSSSSASTRDMNHLAKLSLPNISLLWALICSLFSRVKLSKLWTVNRALLGGWDSDAACLDLMRKSLISAANPFLLQIHTYKCIITVTSVVIGNFLVSKASFGNAHFLFGIFTVRNVVFYTCLSFCPRGGGFGRHPLGKHPHPKAYTPPQTPPPQ